MREWLRRPAGTLVLYGGPADRECWRAQNIHGYWEYWGLGKYQYWEEFEPGSDPKGYCQARVWWDDRETTWSAWEPNPSPLGHPPT